MLRPLGINRRALGNGRSEHEGRALQNDFAVLHHGIAVCVRFRLIPVNEIIAVAVGIGGGSDRHFIRLEELRLRIACAAAVFLKDEPVAARRNDAEVHVAGQDQRGSVRIGRSDIDLAAARQSCVLDWGDVPTHELLIRVLNGVVHIDRVRRGGYVHFRKDSMGTDDRTLFVRVRNDERSQDRSVVVERIRGAVLVDSAGFQHFANQGADLLDSNLLGCVGIVIGCRPSEERDVRADRARAGIVENGLELLVGRIDKIRFLDLNGHDLVAVLVEIDRNTRVVAFRNDHVDGERAAREVAAVLRRLRHELQRAAFGHVIDGELAARKTVRRGKADAYVLRVLRLDPVARRVDERDVDRKRAGEHAAFSDGLQREGFRGAAVDRGHAHSRIRREDARVDARLDGDAVRRDADEVLRRHLFRNRFIVTRVQAERRVYDRVRLDAIAVLGVPADERLALDRRRGRKLADRAARQNRQPGEEVSFFVQENNGVFNCQIRLVAGLDRLAGIRIDRRDRLIRVLGIDRIDGLDRIDWLDRIVRLRRFGRRLGSDGKIRFFRIAVAVAIDQIARVTRADAVVAVVAAVAERRTAVAAVKGFGKRGRRQKLQDHDDRDDDRPEASAEEDLVQLRHVPFPPCVSLQQSCNIL